MVVGWLVVAWEGVVEMWWGWRGFVMIWGTAVFGVKNDGTFIALFFP